MTLNDLECPIHLKVRFTDVRTLWLSDSTICTGTTRGGRWGVGWRAKPSPLHPCGQLTRCFSAVAELLVYHKFNPDPPTLQTDGRTDRRTDDMQSQYRALHCSASRGKNSATVIFTPRQHSLLAERCISYDRFCPTVRPSDRLSVTVRYHAKTTPATIMRSSLDDSPMTLVS